MHMDLNFKWGLNKRVENVLFVVLVNFFEFLRG